MADPYLPTREADLVTFATNFNTKIVAAPTSYGLTAAQATAFTTLFNAFSTAYLTANDPLTRSPANIDAKNIAKDAMINGPGGIRELANIVQATPNMPSNRITELGLTVRDTEPSPIAPPTVAPEIDFPPTTNRIIKIRIHNEQTLSKRKPDGVRGVTLFSFVGENAPADLNDWKFEFNSTKLSFEIDPPVTVQAGTKVWFTAQWFNPRMEVGPATTPVSTVVQYGGLAQAA